MYNSFKDIVNMSNYEIINIDPNNVSNNILQKADVPLHGSQLNAIGKVLAFKTITGTKQERNNIRNKRIGQYIATTLELTVDEIEKKRKQRYATDKAAALAIAKNAFSQRNQKLVLEAPQVPNTPILPSAPQTPIAKGGRNKKTYRKHKLNKPRKTLKSKKSTKNTKHKKPCKTSTTTKQR